MYNVISPYEYFVRFFIQLCTIERIVYRRINEEKKKKRNVIRKRFKFNANLRFKSKSVTRMSPLNLVAIY